MNYSQKGNKNNVFYVEDVLDREHSGWLSGTTSDGVVFPVCYKTRVILLEESGKDQTVRIDEGVNKNIILKIPYKLHDKSVHISFLSKKPPHLKCSLILDLKTNKLKIERIGIFTVEVSGIQTGKYNIQIPLRPIDKNFNPDYYNEGLGGSRFVKTWFRLIPETGLLKDVFLHYGSYSEGCITVLNSNAFSVWNKIYSSLMSSRLNDRYVASLLVR